MTGKLYKAYLSILREELIPALGCTEPIAVALAASKARSLLAADPESMTVFCSGNIIKNVMGVIVPNSGGLRGVPAAAILGMLAGDPEDGLAVLEAVTPNDIEKMHRLLADGFCTCELVEGVENLYIKVVLKGGGHSAVAELSENHTNFTLLEKDGVVLMHKQTDHSADASCDDRDLLSLKDIFDFAQCVRLEDVSELLQSQIDCNLKIAEEGLNREYGAAVGKTLTESSAESDYITQARAYSAAGSDARMSGCPLPVIINSGSGNQGITVCLPVVIYSKQFGISSEKTIRALVLSNLTAIHQKRFIGRLSAYCGAVSAACAAAAGVAYLAGGNYDQICGTVINAIATTDGMVCDGAKSSCAAKIAAAVGAALTAQRMSMKNRVFKPGEGLVRSSAEETIRSVGRMAREGMRTTDVEILKIMLDQPSNL